MVPIRCIPVLGFASNPVQMPALRLSSCRSAYAYRRSCSFGCRSDAGHRHLSDCQPRVSFTDERGFSRSSRHSFASSDRDPASFLAMPLHAPRRCICMCHALSNLWSWLDGIMLGTWCTSDPPSSMEPPTATASADPFLTWWLVGHSPRGPILSAGLGWHCRKHWFRRQFRMFIRHTSLVALGCPSHLVTVR